MVRFDEGERQGTGTSGAVVVAAIYCEGEVRAEGIQRWKVGKKGGKQMKRELIYAAVIGGVVGAVLVMAAGSFSPLGAQSQFQMEGYFDTIVCRYLKVIGTGGKTMVELAVNEEGGTVILRGKDKDDERAAQMTIEKNGGAVRVFGKGNAGSRAVMGVNEYGNGAVSTWDKNGYRLKTLK